MNVIGHKWIFLSVSGVFVAASIAAAVLYGFELGIDLRGGSAWQIRFEEPPAREKLLEFAAGETGLAGAVITEQGEGKFLIRSKEMPEEERSAYAEKLRAAFGPFEELQFSSIGAAVGAELRSKALTAFFLVLLMISFYIAFVFRKVSRPVGSWKYGVITLVTLFHDALIPIGLFALLGKFAGVEVDVNFIVAILVVMGFSVHDTIVVFDRIRENLRTARGDGGFDALVNASVNQTIVRSVNTSLTLVLVLVALYFLGAPSLGYFVLAILVGTVVGTYSSIFVASPLLTIWRKRPS